MARSGRHGYPCPLSQTAVRGALAALQSATEHFSLLATLVDGVDPSVVAAADAVQRAGELVDRVLEVQPDVAA